METKEILEQLDSKMKAKLAEIQAEKEQLVKDSKAQGAKVEDITKKLEGHFEKFEAYCKEQSLTSEQATKAFADFKGEFEKLKGDYAESQKQVDELDRKLQKQGSQSAAAKANLRGALDAYFKDEENMKVFTGMKGKKIKTHNIDLNVPLVQKVVGDMTSGAHYTTTDGDVVTPLHLPGVYRDPVRTVHIRELLNVATTGSPFIEFVKETGGEGAIAPQAGEGAPKAQLDFDLAADRVVVETIAGYVRMSQQMLDDTSFLRTYITTRLTEKLMIQEDVQLLTGNGMSNNLTGLIPNATAFNHGIFWQSDEKAGKYDALVAAIDQATIAEYSPTGILLYPSDYHQLILEKDDNGTYRFPNTVLSGDQPRVAGVPIFKSTAMTVGDFLVADFMKGATLFDRESISIQFSTEDGTNFTKNQVTVRIEERVALAIFLAKAFVTGDFQEVIEGFKST